MALYPPSLSPLHLTFTLPPHFSPFSPLSDGSAGYEGRGAGYDEERATVTGREATVVMRGY